MRYTARLLALFFGLSLNVALSETAAAVNWPDGYVVYVNTASPDGRYGVLVPTVEAWEQDESLSEANYLADIKKHRVLGKIDKVELRTPKPPRSRSLLGTAVQRLRS